jgi:serine/threonine protein kinase
MSETSPLPPSLGCENLSEWLEYKQPLGKGDFGETFKVCVVKDVLRKVYSRFNGANPSKPADLECEMPLLSKVSILETPRTIERQKDPAKRLVWQANREAYENEVKALKYLTKAMDGGKLKRGAVPTYYASFTCPAPKNGKHRGKTQAYILESLGAPLTYEMERVLENDVDPERQKFYLNKRMSAQRSVDFLMKLASLVRQLEALRLNHNDLHYGNVVLREKYDPAKPDDYDLMFIDFGMASSDAAKTPMQPRDVKHWLPEWLRQRRSEAKPFRSGADLFEIVFNMPNASPIKKALLRGTSKEAQRALEAYNDMLLAPEEVTREFEASRFIQRLEDYARENGLRVRRSGEAPLAPSPKQQRRSSGVETWRKSLK